MCLLAWCCCYYCCSPPGQLLVPPQPCFLFPFPPLRTPLPLLPNLILIPPVAVPVSPIPEHMGDVNQRGCTGLHSVPPAPYKCLCKASPGPSRDLKIRPNSQQPTHTPNRCTRRSISTYRCFQDSTVPPVLTLTACIRSTGLNPPPALPPPPPLPSSSDTHLDSLTHTHTHTPTLPHSHTHTHYLFSSRPCSP